MKTPAVRSLPVTYADTVSGRFPSFHRSGSITGMRQQFYGAQALLVRCGQWIYNVSSAPELYYKASK